MNEQEQRLNAEFMRFLHTLATDRSCFVIDLSTTITSAAMNLALEAYRMGIEDGQRLHGPRSHHPTVRAPYADKVAPAASQLPTRPPPPGVRRRVRTTRPPVPR